MPFAESDFLLENYDYRLPEALVAQEPLAKRDSSRLLIMEGESLREAAFSSLPDLLPA